MDGLSAGARLALLEAIRASALLVLVEREFLPGPRPNLEFDLREFRAALLAYRNVGVDLRDLGVDAAPIRNYLGDLNPES